MRRKAALDAPDGAHAAAGPNGNGGSAGIGGAHRRRGGGHGVGGGLSRGPGAGVGIAANGSRETSTSRPGQRSRRRSRRSKRRAARLARRHLVTRHPVWSSLVAALFLATPVWVSLGTALTNPSLGVTIPGRFAEWVRDHGGASIVSWGENFYYSHHPPPVGGKPPKGAIPPPPTSNESARRQSATKPASGTPGLTPLPAPPPIQPIANPPLPGEGQWHPAGRLVDGVPAVYEAFLRPDAVHTSLVAGVAWMDTRLLGARLYSGSTIPGGGPYRYTAPIQPSAAGTLVAAFNAGFLMSNAEGGYYTDGKVIDPLRQGGASFVIYKDGSVQIGSWGTEVGMTPQVVSVRQNLNMLVDNGQPVAGLNPNDNYVWGATLGAAVDVWRSAVGQTADGALVYVAGPGLNITSLANLLVSAGAVRGMELDINTDWVDFATFDPSTPGAPALPANGRNLLAGMAGTPDRYFASWWGRDFFTMSARAVPGGPNP